MRVRAHATVFCGTSDHGLLVFQLTAKAVRLDKEDSKTLYADGALKEHSNRKNATPRGFEPLRAEPNGFLAYLLIPPSVPF